MIFSGFVLKGWILSISASYDFWAKDDINLTKSFMGICTADLYRNCTVKKIFKQFLFFLIWHIILQCNILSSLYISFSWYHQSHKCVFLREYVPFGQCMDSDVLLFQCIFSLCLVLIPLFEEASRLSLWFFDAKDTQWLSTSPYETLIIFLHLGGTPLPWGHSALSCCGDSLMMT